MLSCRKNISITNEDVAIALERAENASKFVEQAILYYLEEHEKEYATLEDLNSVKEKIEILNKNYAETLNVLNQISKVLFK